MQSIFETLATIGHRMIIVVGVLFVADLAAMIIYTIRKGTPNDDDDSPDGMTDSDGSLTADAAGTLASDQQLVAANYKTKKKTLIQQSGFVSDDSLADGTATAAERMMVHGIQVFFVLFWLLFVSAGMIGMKSNPLAVFLIIVPTIWFLGNVRSWRKDAASAKKRVQSREGGA